MFTVSSRRPEFDPNSGQNSDQNSGCTLAQPLTGEAQQRPKTSIFSETKAVLGNFRKAKVHRGEGLVSIMFYMFIVAVIILGVVSLFFSVQNSWRETAATVLQNQLVAAVAKVYGTNQQYGTIDMIPTLDGFGALPDSAQVTGGGATAAMTHPFGGAIKIMGLITTYSIAFEALDNETCAVLASKGGARSRSRSGIVSITASADGTGPALPDPVTAVQINDACIAGDGANTVKWVYR